MPTLTWVGKEKIINHHNDVPYKTLKKIYTFNAEESDNMIIHGDNLVALKSLLPRYEGIIDSIYIDPPYNTGNEHWIYNDNVNDPRIKKWLGEVVGKENEDLTRHDKWLCMMYPRIKLMYKLLSSTGTLFISIDEHEIAYLSMICEEIFSKNNIDYLIWQKNDSKVDRNTNAKIINRTKNIHEYILCCFKNKKETFFNKMMRMPSWSKSCTNPDKDPRGPWQSGIISFEEGHAKEDKNSDYYYSIKTPSGKIYTRHWFVLREEWDRLVADNRISFPKNGDGVPRLKTFQNEEKEYYMDSILTGVGTSSSAKDEIELLFGKRDLFDTPKPLKLIKELVRVSTNKNSIVLDCFAGSGTTGHAVLDINKEDGGNRKFIEIEMMDYAESIIAERTKKAINGYGDIAGIPGDFSFYELGDSLFDGNGNLNSNLSIEEIKKYIFYTETQQEPILDDGDFLGSSNDTGYFFNYNKDESTCLNMKYLRNIKKKFSYYVIYADTCMLSNEILEKYHIIFKKIPRDIIKY